jgi:hypothetical protein
MYWRPEIVLYYWNRIVLHNRNSFVVLEGGKENISISVSRTAKC